MESRPSRGGVGRNDHWLTKVSKDAPRPSRGGVDRNTETGTGRSSTTCRPSRGGVDRNIALLRCDQPPTSPLAWGRGSKLRVGEPRHQAVAVAPRVGAWIETILQEARANYKA